MHSISQLWVAKKHGSVCHVTSLVRAWKGDESAVQQLWLEGRPPLHEFHLGILSEQGGLRVSHLFSDKVASQESYFVEAFGATKLFLAAVALFGRFIL